MKNLFKLFNLFLICFSLLFCSSCGEDNSYGHPHVAILNYCRTEKIPLYRTDKQGTIVLKSDGENIEWNMAPAE